MASEDDDELGAQPPPVLDVVETGRGARGEGGVFSSMAPSSTPATPTHLLPRSVDAALAVRGEDQHGPLRPQAEGSALVETAHVQAGAPDGSRGPGERSPAATDTRLGRLTAKDRHQAFIARVDGQIRKRASGIVAAMGLAADIDDEGVPVDQSDAGRARWESLSPREKNIAKDARRPLKTQPGYLASQVRILDSYKRAEADKPVAPTLNANVVTVTVNQQINYAVKDVTDE